MELIYCNTYAERTYISNLPRISCLHRKELYSGIDNRCTQVSLSIPIFWGEGKHLTCIFFLIIQALSSLYIVGRFFNLHSHLQHNVRPLAHLCFVVCGICTHSSPDCNLNLAASARERNVCESSYHYRPSRLIIWLRPLYKFLVLN